jgi:hypothetical protein
MRSKTDIAITSMSVSRHDGATAIVGTEAGVVFQALLNSDVELEPDKLDAAGIVVDEGKWIDPVKSTFAGHTGRVLDIKVKKAPKIVFHVTSIPGNGNYLLRGGGG